MAVAMNNELLDTDPEFANRDDTDIHGGAIRTESMRFCLRRDLLKKPEEDTVLSEGRCLELQEFMRSLDADYSAIEQKLTDLSNEVPLFGTSVAHCTRDLQLSLGKLAGCASDGLPEARVAVRRLTCMNQLLDEISDVDVVVGGSRCC